jgi:3'(2'), 5'-bisphosphate nucleotidase
LIEDEKALLEALVVAARAAGAEILKLVEAGFEIETKNDESPVTVCDRAAEQVILEFLRQAAPGVPVIAEEEVAAGRIPAHDDTYFLVDPLDGTKEFIRGGDDYTVNIGLIAGGVPRLGVVYQPAVDKLWAGLVGEGAFVEENGERRSITCRPLGDSRAAVASKSHLTQSTIDYLSEVIGLCDHVSIGSSLKFCIIAEGYRGRPCGPVGRGGTSRRARRQTVGLWQEGVPQPRILRDGRLGSPGNWTVHGAIFKRRRAACGRLIRPGSPDHPFAASGHVPQKLHFGPNRFNPETQLQRFRRKLAIRLEYGKQPLRIH